MYQRNYKPRKNPQPFMNDSEYKKYRKEQEAFAFVGKVLWIVLGVFVTIVVGLLAYALWKGY